MEQAATLIKREQGHSTNGRPFLNVAGIAYLAFVCVYSAFLLYGLVLLWLHRANTAIRIRGFPILMAAILAIHVYVAAVFIVYPLNGWYKCGTEFWYMSVVFPLGIAIFQVSNIRLLAYAKKQRELVNAKCWGEEKQHFELRTRSGFKAWFQRSDWVKQSYIYIGVGLLIQLIVSFTLFFGSRRFSPTIGRFGHVADSNECRRGAEWIPSVIWQFVSTWMLGPWVLYKSRHIKDTHYWALQTRLVVLAGLPGTPLWLAFLYSNNRSVQAVSEWWLPAMWFAPGLIMMQVTSIVIPLYDALHKRHGRRPDSVASTYSEDTMVSNASTVRTLASIDGRRSKELASSFEAFEFQLRHNIDPLFFFAAYRDFTAENIQFLREVRDFKRKWRRLTTCPPAADLLISQADQHRMFEDAARIYFELICRETSKCSINIDSKTYKKLQDMFKGLVYTPSSDSFDEARPALSMTEPKHSSISDVSGNHVAPWSSPLSTPRSRSPVRMNSQSTVTGSSYEYEMPDDLALLAPTCSLPAVTKSSSISVEVIEASPTKGGLTATGETLGSPYGVNSVPYLFEISVFDSAEASVKYLVYTNTWKGFVAGADVENLVSIHETTLGRTLVAHNISPVELEEFESEATEAGFHHGILDLEQGPVAFEQVNAKCAHCRRRDVQRAEMRLAVLGK